MFGPDKETREKFIFTVSLVCPIKESAICGDREGASAHSRCTRGFYLCLGVTLFKKIFILILFIYLAAPSLSCSTQDLCCQVQDL